MRNADGIDLRLMDLLTCERLRAAKAKLAAARNLAAACAAIGDEANCREATRDWAAARRVTNLLEGRAA
jgi:hypothetical protein